MKLAILLIVLCTMQISASVTMHGQVSINMQNQSLRDVFKEIENQSPYRFFYNEAFADLDKRIDVSVKNMMIQDTMDELLYQSDMSYKVLENNLVVIAPRKELQQHEVTGLVTDGATGEPLPGVTIIIKGTNRGTTSDMDGNYTLEDIDPEDILVFSFVGYETQEIMAGDRNVIDVVISELLIGLDEVVVVGYGTQKKVNLTGSVANITAAELENRVSDNLLGVLEGQSGNLNIQTTGYGGEPGATLSLNIRGVGTLTSGGNQPYILVDGMPMDISNVNPMDVESVSILKDAAASAIYGARAPYGVILVTTKKGKKDEPPVVQYSNNISLAHPEFIPDQANSMATAIALNYAQTNSGKPPTYNQELLNRIQAYLNGEITDETFIDPAHPLEWRNAYADGGNANNDWPHLWYDNWALRQKHDLSFHGGGNHSTYYLSTGFYGQDGVLSWGDEYYEKYNISANINTDVTEWMTMDFHTKYMSDNTIRPSGAKPGHDRTNLWLGLPYELAINPVYSPDGRYINQRIVEFTGSGEEKTQDNDLWINVGSILEPIEDWQTHINYIWNYSSLRFGSHHKTTFFPTADGGERAWRHRIPSYRQQFTDNRYNLFNLRTSYRKLIGYHYFEAMVGYEQEYAEYRSMDGEKKNLISNLVPSFSTATGEITMNDSWSHWSTMGSFIRLSYNFQEKYLFEFNGRYDGSSRFENADTQWGFFPSLSLGYNIYKEPFWETIKDLISMDYFRIRASIGSLGNQNVQNYLYLPIIGVGSNLNWIIGNQRPVYSVTPSLVSPELTWETSNTINLGIDAGFFNNRLNLIFDLYKRNTINMFGPAESLPLCLGTSPSIRNNAELETKGFELDISWRDNIFINDLYYSIRLTLGDNKSKIVKYNNPTNYIYNWYEGKIYGDIWGYETVEFFQEGENIDDHADQSAFYPEWQAGDIKYKDLNGDGKITWGDNTLDDHGDLKIIGNSQSRYLFGIITTMNYKGFDFRMFWQGVGKRDMDFGLNRQFFGFIGADYGNCMWEPHLDYWTSEGADHGGGPDAYFPRPYTTSEHRKNTRTQTKYIQNAAYIKLKNIQLGYNIPKKITESMRIKKARIFVTGENLLTFTGLINTFDPANIAVHPRGAGFTGTSYPICELYSIGVNITF